MTALPTMVRTAMLPSRLSAWSVEGPRSIVLPYEKFLDGMERLAPGVRFDETVSEVHDTDSVRYILRRNPMRAVEIAKTRSDDRQEAVRQMDEQSTGYLAEHPQRLVAGRGRVP